MDTLAELVASFFVFFVFFFQLDLTKRANGKRIEAPQDLALVQL